VLGSYFWLYESISLLDFSFYEFLDKCILIGLATKGMFDFYTLKEFSNKDFEYIYLKSKDIVMKLYGKSEGSNG